MEQHREYYIAQLVLDNFKQVSGIEVELEAMTLTTRNRTNGYMPDGLLKLTIDGKKLSFMAEIKHHADQMILPKILKYCSEHPNERFVIIAETITPSLKETLKTNQIGYIDMAGNAYLRSPNIFIDREGYKVPMTKTIIRKPTPKMLQVIFQLLLNPELCQLPQIRIAKQCDVTTEIVRRTFDFLLKKRFILKKDTKTYMMAEIELLREKWLTDYNEILKPNLLIGNYRFLKPDTCREQWQFIQFDMNTVWGGEPAAALRTNYLQPELFTIYTTELPQKIVKNYQLIPDKQGYISVYKKFWQDEKSDEKHLSPDLLIYSDLLYTGNPRNIETAQRLEL